MNGSEWGRWDLHIHTPSTLHANEFAGDSLEEKWERYASTIEAKGEVATLGITDYFTIEGYKTVREMKAAGRLQNVTLILPNIELRVVPMTGEGIALNVHVIAGPEIVDELDTLLFERLGFQYAGTRYSATTKSLMRLGEAVHGHGALPPESALAKGAAQFKVEPSDLYEAFASPRLRENALIVLANGHKDGWSGLKDSGISAMRRELCRQANAIFTGRPKDREFFLGRGDLSPEVMIQRFGGLKPCIHGCDAHSLERVLEPDEKRYCWIKAEPTFEGLRQICFEPEYRVHIGEYPPSVPVNRILSLRTDFPEGTTLRTGDIEAPFCVRGPLEFPFSSGLTCLIGGRGAGKSTLLNLLAAAARNDVPAFFKQHELRLDGGPVAASDRINIATQGSITGIDIIGQNDVESFASDPSRLTNAILTRLLGADPGGALRMSLESADAAVGRLREGRALVARLAEIDDARRATSKELAGVERLIESIADPEYVAVTAALDAAERELSSIRRSRETLKALISKWRESARAAESALKDDQTDRFAGAVRAAVSTLAEFTAKLVAETDPDSESSEETSLQRVIESKRQELEKFLQSRGLAEENLATAANASSRRAKLQLEDQTLAEEEGNLTAGLPGIYEADKARREGEAQLAEALRTINGLMSDANPDKPIELYMAFDEEQAQDDFIDELANALEKFRGGQRPRSDYLRSVIKPAGHPLKVCASDVYKVVRGEEAKHAQQLDAYLGVSRHGQDWDIAQASFRADLRKYLRIGVRYGGRDLAAASFGQRCAAVLFVLLALGNAPVVIDEPEAHLDSSIIAGTLVPLIKRRKAQRQVIFATHNANFVVNGDAELIHFVHMDEDDHKTTVASFGIETLEHRDTLLRLEGGRHAFEVREEKYGP